MTHGIAQLRSSSTASATAGLAICGALVLCYGVFIALGSQRGFPESMTPGEPMPYLSDKPVGEDGFYMLTVAWHLAEGRGLVYNFDLPTDGVQPLSTVLYAGMAWLVQQAGGDRWMLLRMVQLLGVLNLFLLALVVGYLARSALEDEAARGAAFLVAASLTAFNFWLYRALTYGLETGLYLVLLAGCVAFTLRVLPRMTTRSALLLGLLAGATGLARIDFGVVLFGFLGAGILSRSLRLRHALIVGATALVVLLPWFLWVHHVSGSWLPSSGGAQTSLISGRSGLIRLEAGAKAFLNHLTPWLYTGARGLPSLVALVSLVVLFLFLRRRPLAPQRHVVRTWRRTMALWGVALVPLCIVYVLFFGVTHFYERYTSPVLIVLLPLLSVLVVRRVPPARMPWAVAVPVLMTACFGLWAGFSLHGGRVGNTHAVTAGFVHEHFPPPHIVGAFQSGVIGYFNPNVVNLDGKLNQAALEARRQGRLAAHVDSSRIGVLVDWPGHLTAFFPRSYREQWAPCEEHPNNRITLCIIRSPAR